MLSGSLCIKEPGMRRKMTGCQPGASPCSFPLPAGYAPLGLTAANRLPAVTPKASLPSAESLIHTHEGRGALPRPSSSYPPLLSLSSGRAQLLKRSAESALQAARPAPWLQGQPALAALPSSASDGNPCTRDKPCAGLPRWLRQCWPGASSSPPSRTPLPPAPATPRR